MALFAINIAEGAYDKVVAVLESVGHTLEPIVDDCVSEITTDIKLLDAAALPALATFVKTLTGQVAQAVMKAGPSALALLASGGWVAAASTEGAAALAAVTGNAPADATAALQQVQAALQVVKVASNTVTDADAPTVAALAAATPQ